MPRAFKIEDLDVGDGSVKVVLLAGPINFFETTCASIAVAETLGETWLKHAWPGVDSAMRHGALPKYENEHTV